MKHFGHNFGMNIYLICFSEFAGLLNFRICLLQRKRLIIGLIALASLATTFGRGIFPNAKLNKQTLEVMTVTVAMVGATIFTTVRNLFQIEVKEYLWDRLGLDNGCSFSLISKAFLLIAPFISDQHLIIGCLQHITFAILLFISQVARITFSDDQVEWILGSWKRTSYLVQPYTLKH